MNDIVKEILCQIKEKYDVLYMKGITVEKNGNQYILTLDLNNSDRPLYISGEFDTDEKFIKFIMEEFRIRKPFPRYGWEYFRVNRVPAPDPDPNNPDKLTQLLEQGKIIQQ